MNPTTNQNNAAARAEIAAAAYIRNFYDVRGEDPAFDKSQLDILARRPGTVLDGVRIYEGQTPLNFAMPAVVVNAPGSTPLTGDAAVSWREVTLEVHVMTQLEEGNEGTEEEGETSGTAKDNAPAEHGERVGQVMELFSDEDVVMTQFNQPEEGDDERAVKKFALFGFWFEGEQTTQQELHWDTVLTFKFHCSPYDRQVS